MFREGDDVLYLEPPSVVKHRIATERAEHLVAAVVDPEKLCLRRPVIDRREKKIEAPLIVIEMPRQIITAAQIKVNGAELMRRPVIEKDVLRRRGRIAEAAAQIESEHFPGQISRAVTPVPFVVKWPDAPPPVQNAEGFFRLEAVFGCAVADKSFGRHTVDLVIIVEGSRRFFEGNIDDEGIRVFSRKNNLRLEIIPDRMERPRVACCLERYTVPLLVIGELMVLFGILRHMKRAKREHEKGPFLDELHTFCEVEKHHRGLPRVGGVPDGKLQAHGSVAYLIEVPLLDAVRRSFDGFAVVREDTSE